MNTRRLREQIGLLKVIQHNVRQWLQLRTWVWFKLYGKVRPLLAAGKENEAVEKLEEQLKSVQENLAKEAETRKKLEEESKKMAEEREELLKQLDSTKGRGKEVQERLESLASAKEHLESALEEVRIKEKRTLADSHRISRFGTDIFRPLSR